MVLAARATSATECFPYRTVSADALLAETLCVASILVVNAFDPMYSGLRASARKLGAGGAVANTPVDSVGVEDEGRSEMSTAKQPSPDESIVRASRRATVSAFLTHPATMVAAVVSGSDDCHPTGWFRKAGRSGHEDLLTVSKNPWIASRVYESQRSDISADP
jgi:hypothetical protein